MGNIVYRSAMGRLIPPMTEKEVEDFIRTKTVVRLATCSRGIPHVVPLGYIYEDGYLLSAVTYETRKVRDILENESVACVIDTWPTEEDWPVDEKEKIKGVMIKGTATIDTDEKVVERVSNATHPGESGRKMLDEWKKLGKQKLTYCVIRIKINEISSWDYGKPKF